ncbi:RidA family protein [Kineobactrum salinum]|uniref:RidA family protein n=1 Tax=Kineobactrum salinum TaxID=2708301 RepID=A0A6C0U405_9GAMM|nr:RidA family protein [Kineobactrum salinum]QIB65105.1 hypothetical protein G3T16_06515 [Kineobactrum salinum]
MSNRKTTSIRQYIGTSPMVKRAVAGFKISRAVSIGDWLFTNGQMDIGAEAKVLNPGDIVAQTVTCMRSVYELVARTDYRLADLAQLQVFYLGDSVVNETSYRKMILEEFPECRDTLLVMTRVPSFATVGHEVEIDAIAVSGQRACVRNDTGMVRGVRRGDWVFANSRVRYDATDVCDDLCATLGKLDAHSRDVCRLYVYYSAELSPQERARIERNIAQYFHGVPATYHAAIVPGNATPDFAVELEVIANSSSTAEKAAYGCAVAPAGEVEWPFVDALCCADLVFTSGQFPLDATGAVQHPTDIANQSRVVMRRLAATLNRAGVDTGDLVKIKTYFEGAWNLDNWLDNLNARMESLSDPGPASTGIEGLSPVVAGALLSVDGIASRK